MVESYQRYKAILDPADTLFAANFVLGYFGSVDDAPHLMRLQKIEDLKRKGLWEDRDSFDSAFKTNEVIDPTNPDFGINVYAVGAAVDGRKQKPPHEKLLELTTTHTVSGGWGCYNFVLSLTRKHQTAKLVIGQVPKDEFVLGFIQFDSGVLNNRAIQSYLDIPNLNPDFVNQHLVCGKGIVPTQPFGSLLRGGKLVALIATANELRDFYNHNFKKPRRLTVFYTTSLYGSSKQQSQYEQLDRYLKFIGETSGTFPLRMKDPQKAQLINWMDDRGINRSEFVFSGSNKADRSHIAITKFIRHCLWKHHYKDENIKKVLKRFDSEMLSWSHGRTEKKRTYLSLWGFDHFTDNIVNPDYETNDEYDLAAVFAYWKTKVFKKKDWGMRKSDVLKNDIHLKYDLIQDDLRNPNFNQVR
jgi:hypothetical protein